ncbi:TetR/AcrR family transcriptional regulator [Clostridium tagluense]|uniref:TetR/AcrR family transcriptional regulator n=1 Tax=Clostridium tagluense TaxID=360422 RepID=UPI001CF1EFF8|nr:TetR/AcrR family transcriptional regulator [Clostridium tagluense]MCB2300453.1 TetR/AcrR family transcriptional regulator [Clostridium tagluense]
MDNKEIQKRRMMGYFLEATKTIIETDGISAVTIRKVASMAGFNSATVYNYFENLNHLIFFASLRYLKDYAEALPKYTMNSKNSFENYVNVWKCFSYYSYLRPEIYNLIFFTSFSHTTVNSSIKTYYSIFPEEIGEETKKFLPMLFEDNINIRDYTVLKAAAAEGFFKDEDLNEINEMNVLIYEGMLSRLLSGKNDYTVEIAVEKTLTYIKRTLMAYRIDIV